MLSQGLGLGSEFRVRISVIIRPFFFFSFHPGLCQRINDMSALVTHCFKLNTTLVKNSWALRDHTGFYSALPLGRWMKAPLYLGSPSGNSRVRTFPGRWVQWQCSVAWSSAVATSRVTGAVGSAWSWDPQCWRTVPTSGVRFGCRGLYLPP